jgi:hypothetical protein
MKMQNLNEGSESLIKTGSQNNLDSTQKLSMECSKCSELGFTSTIRRSTEGWTTTAYRYPFNDEQGRKHHHLVEITTRAHWCSEGHYFETKERTTCWCGWPVNKEFE